MFFLVEFKHEGKSTASAYWTSANEDGLGYTWLLSWQNPFYRDGLQVVFKSILLKFLGQLCMLTKFTNKTCLCN